MEEVVKAAAVLVERAGPDRLDAERGEAKSDELLAVDDARREAGESELNAAIGDRRLDRGTGRDAC